MSSLMRFSICATYCTLSTEFGTVGLNTASPRKKCVPPAGPEAVEQGAHLMREEDGSFMEAIVLPGWLFVLLGHFGVGDELHGEILRHGTLRQQLRHDDQPHFAGIGHVILAAAGGKGQDGVLRAEGDAIKAQPVLFGDLLEEVGLLLAGRVRHDVVEVGGRNKAGGDLEDHIAALHREIDVGVLLDIVGVQVAVQRGELGTVGIAVIGGVAEDGGVFIQLAPALEVVIAVGIVAAPFAVILVFILLQVIGVVLRLQHGVIHIGTGHIQPRYGVGIVLFCSFQLLLAVHGGDNLADRLRLRRLGNGGVGIIPAAAGRTDGSAEQNGNNKGARNKTGVFFHKFPSLC